MMIRIIAVCGNMRCGKDMAANYISKNYRPMHSSSNYTNVKFAGKLKSVCGQLFGLSVKQMESDEKDVVDPRYKKTPREILQYFGTDIGKRSKCTYNPHCS
jgi:hypothetical protein